MDHDDEERPLFLSGLAQKRWLAVLVVVALAGGAILTLLNLLGLLH